MTGKLDRAKWGFLLPALIYLMILAIFPLIWALGLSFTRWEALSQALPRWIGLKNYQYFLFQNPRFWHDLGFTLEYVVSAVVIELSLGTGLALLLSQQFRGKNFFRVIYVMPMASPPIAIAFLWRMILNPDTGILNSAIRAIGLHGVKWTTSTTIAPIAIIMVDIWEWTPFMFLAVLAALQTVSKELYESAVVDGAGAWQMFKSITLPIIMPIVITITIIRSIDAFKLYALVFGITSAGPGGATESLSFYIYQIGITWFNLGQASAVSWLFLIVMITLAMVLISRFRRDTLS